MSDNATASPCRFTERGHGPQPAKTTGLSVAGIAGLATACVAVWLLIALLPAGGVETVPSRFDHAWEQSAKRQMRLHLFASAAAGIGADEPRAEAQERSAMQRAAAAPAAGAPIGGAGLPEASVAAKPTADLQGRDAVEAAIEPERIAAPPLAEPGGRSSDEADTRPASARAGASAEASDAAKPETVAVIAPEVAVPERNVAAEASLLVDPAPDAASVAAPVPPSPPPTSKKQPTRTKAQRPAAGGGSGGKAAAVAAPTETPGGNRHHWRSVFGEQ